MRDGRWMMNDEPAARRNFPPKQNRGASAEATSHANWYVAGRHLLVENLLLQRRPLLVCTFQNSHRYY